MEAAGPQMAGPLTALLEAIYGLGFESDSPELLVKTMDVWELLLDHLESEPDLITSHASGGLDQGHASSGSMYRACIVAVASGILKRSFLKDDEGKRFLCQLDATPGSAMASLSEHQQEDAGAGTAMAPLIGKRLP